MFSRKRVWLIVLLCLTLSGVGAGFTVGDSFTVSSPAAGGEKGVYVMDVEYLGPDADYIKVKCKNEVVAEFYDVEAGDILHIDGTGLPKGKLEADTRFYIDLASGGDTIEIKIHTSCSKPLAVGMIFDDDHPWLEVVYLDATGGECEPGCPPPDEPDLVVSGKWETWQNYTHYIVHFVVLNQGDETVPAGHDVGLFIDGSEQPQHIEVPVSLDPGETWESSFTTPITISGDSDAVQVCADHYDEVDESNEDNNCLQNTVTQEPVPEGPDLVISSKWEEWVCDTQYMVHFVVLNQGDETVPAGHNVTLYIDNSEQPEHVEVPVDLSPGESWESGFSASITVSGNEDTVKVCADNFDEVDEANEANNCRANLVQTEEECPDCCTDCFTPQNCCDQEIYDIWMRVNEIECLMMDIRQQQAELEAEIMHVRIETDEKVKQMKRDIERIKSRADMEMTELRDKLNKISQATQQDMRMIEIRVDAVERRAYQEISRMERQITDIEKRAEWKVVGLEKKFTGMEKELMRLSNKLDYVEREVAKMESRVTTAELQTQQLWARLNEIEQGINSLEVQLSQIE